MKILDIVGKIENSSEYKNFIEKNPDCYLVHMFCMRDAQVDKDWQIGYYGKKSDKITVFDYKDDTITMMPAEEAFKEKNYIAALKLDTVNIDADDAMAKAEEILKAHYSAESIIKAIVLLQNLPEHGQIWNITVITMTFHVINIKIDASSGKIIKHTKESLLGWKKE